MLERLQEEFYLCFIEEERWRFLTSGLANTLQITLFAVLLGIAIGIVAAVVRSSHDKIAAETRGIAGILLRLGNAVCQIYLTVIRGTPVMVQLMIMYYVIFASSRNGVAVATLAFGVNSGAYVAEIFRAGIMSIDSGQFEAGRSLGFSYAQTMRYIVIPQAFKAALPSLANEFIVLLKETSVAGYVTVRDLTMGGNIIRSATYIAFMPLLAVALIYLVMVVFFSRLVGRLERRLRNSER